MSLSHVELLRQLPKAYFSGYKDIPWRSVDRAVLEVILSKHAPSSPNPGFLYLITVEFARLKASKESTRLFLHTWCLSRAARRVLEFQLQKGYTFAIIESKKGQNPVPSDVYEPGLLNRNAIRVYEAVYTVERELNCFELGLAEVVKATGLQRTSVRRAMAELDEKGFVVTLERGGTRDKKCQKSVYRFLNAMERDALRQARAETV